MENMDLYPPILHLLESMRFTTYIFLGLFMGVKYYLTVILLMIISAIHLRFIVFLCGSLT